MTRKEIIQEMQMCLECQAFFPRDTHILAHEIGMHVRWWIDRYEDIDGEAHWFINSMTFGHRKRSKLEDTRNEVI